MYIIWWQPQTRRSEGVHWEPMVFTKDVGMEIRNVFQWYWVIYINRSIWESDWDLCNHNEQHMYVCAKREGGPSQSILLQSEKMAMAILLGNQGVWVLLMVVQIAYWSKRCGDTFGSSGGIAGILCVGGRCTNNHFHGTQINDERFSLLSS